MLNGSASSPNASVGRVWSSSALIDAAPSEVLDALTDPALIARWSPVGFELEHLDGRRLRSGSHARITGTAAGVKSSFEVEVLQADDDGLELRARGPVDMTVAYRLADCAEGTSVQATIALQQRRGMTAQLLRAATAALLNQGALDQALAQLAGGVAASGVGASLAA
jgi:uncharacterized protein YndB with AHSA1/START domain